MYLVLTSLLALKKVAAKSFQIDLGDTDTGGLLLASQVRLLLVGQGEQVHPTDNAPRPVQTFFDELEREKRVLPGSKMPESLCKRKMQTLSPQLTEELS